MHSSLAIDSTVAQTFSVSVTHGVANALISFRRFTAELLVLG